MEIGGGEDEMAKEGHWKPLVNSAVAGALPNLQKIVTDI
jgi:hypothetical protein